MMCIPVGSDSAAIAEEIKFESIDQKIGKIGFQSLISLSAALRYMSPKPPAFKNLRISLQSHIKTKTRIPRAEFQNIPLSFRFLLLAQVKSRGVTDKRSVQIRKWILDELPPEELETLTFCERLILLEALTHEMTDPPLAEQLLDSILDLFDQCTEDKDKLDLLNNFLATIQYAPTIQTYVLENCFPYCIAGLNDELLCKFCENPYFIELANAHAGLRLLIKGRIYKFLKNLNLPTLQCKMETTASLFLNKGEFLDFMRNVRAHLATNQTIDPYDFYMEISNLYLLHITNQNPSLYKQKYDSLLNQYKQSKDQAAFFDILIPEIFANPELIQKYAIEHILSRCILETSNPTVIIAFCNEDLFLEIPRDFKLLKVMRRKIQELTVEEQVEILNNVDSNNPLSLIVQEILSQSVDII